MAVFDDTKPWNEKLTLFRNHVAWSQGNIPRANKTVPEMVEVAQKEPLQEECLHFLRCCQSRISPKTNGEEGLRVLKVLQAAQASLMEDGEAKHPCKNAPEGKMETIEQVHYFSHPSSIIDPAAQIDEGVKIWHFCHIMANAVIGPHCNIGQNVVVSPGVILGSNVKVQNNVSIYSGVVCEDDVFLGPSMVFTNVTNPRSSINRRGSYQKTLVKRGATIGANATIVCGRELGAYCFIGAGAVVTKDVKPYALIVGNPGKQMGWMSRNGEKLNLPLRSPPGQTMRAICPSSGEEYLLSDDILTLVADLSQNPAELSTFI